MEYILQEHVLKHCTNANELKDLIQRVLRRPDFDADEVDHDMPDSARAPASDEGRGGWRHQSKK